MKARQSRSASKVSPAAAQPAPAPLSPERERIFYAVSSLLLLVPCFWQSRLQYGDLLSHIYNSWLAQLIHNGQAPGLVIAPQKTNILFDWILSALFRAAGPGPAQRISVALCVLVFVWGAFAFVYRLSGSRPWALLPLIGVLAYGWTLHMGFLNFYLSLGLCLWAMTLAFTWTPRGLALAGLVFLVAVVAHALPVFWAAGITAYAWLWQRLPAQRRPHLLGGALAALLLAVIVLRNIMPTLWFPEQILLNILGVDQAMVFGMWYTAIFFGLVFLCAVLLIQRIRGAGLQTFWSLPFQLWILTVAAIALVPNRISIPGYQNSLFYISGRISLAGGVCLCTVIAAVPANRFIRYGIAALTVLFFGFLYVDEATLNGIEDRMQALVWQLPPGQRVISGIVSVNTRVEVMTHMIDRICVGHCYSYANYEPSTLQFRIRATGPNPIVVSDYMKESSPLQTGSYVVKDRDAPLYQVRLNDAGQMEIRILPAGATTSITPMAPF